MTDLDRELTKNEKAELISAIVHLMSTQESDAPASTYKHMSRGSQYALLMGIVEEIESMSFEWNGQETSFNILIEYDHVAVTFDGMEYGNEPVSIKSYGTDGDKLEALIKTLYRLSQWYQNCYQKTIVGYQIYVDDSLEHTLHESYELIDHTNEYSIGDFSRFTEEAFTKYPNSEIKFVPVVRNEIENPKFVN